MCHIRSTAGTLEYLRYLRVLKAHRLLYHSTLGLIVIKKKKRGYLRGEGDVDRHELVPTV